MTREDIDNIINTICTDDADFEKPIISPKYLKQELEQLALEQEPSGDLISRDAVIDIIHRFFTEEVDKIPTKKTEDGEVYVIHKCQPLFEMNKAICKRIKALPSVSPTQNCVGNALDMRCGDAISRQAVIDALCNGCELFKNGEQTCFTKCEEYHFLATLPPVTPQPKTGHWIEHPEKETSTPEYLMFYECSECGDKQCFCKSDIHKKRFCSNCGCRMVEPQESEEI